VGVALDLIGVASGDGVSSYFGKCLKVVVTNENGNC
jgi:hypothetical protein